MSGPSIDFERLLKRVSPATPIPIPLLRSDRDACEGRLRAAIRLVQETLAGLREECAHVIGEGKKVVLS